MYISRQKMSGKNLIYWMKRPLNVMKSISKIRGVETAPNWAYAAVYLDFSIPMYVFLSIWHYKYHTRGFLNFHTINAISVISWFGFEGILGALFIGIFMFAPLGVLVSLILKIIYHNDLKS
ncbi:MAG: hypothetical protein Q8900_10730 [Bacillota bacterium]|nr:hypothetical protein [Bacillota bacterium]